MKPALLFLLMFLLACDKDDTVTGGANREKATIIDAGDTAYGCGWLIKIDDDNNQLYHPDNLPDIVKQDNLDVWVDYINTTDSFYCGDFVLSTYPLIHITGITPR